MHTVVIGAGTAGLAASQVLHRQGVPHVVLERGRVGDSWRTKRWDSFCLNTPAWASHLDGQEAEADPGAFLHRDEVVAGLERYRHEHDLPVRERVTVTGVHRVDGGFEVACASGETLHCERVVVATGDQNVPRTPELAQSLPGWLHQVHAADYRSPDGLPPGGVFVVGSGQTGAQIAEELVAAGRPTWLCTSRVGRLPRRYRGKDSLHWAALSGYFEQRVADLPDPSMAGWAQPLISGTRGGHGLSLPRLARLGVTLLGRLGGFTGAVAHIFPAP